MDKKYYVNKNGGVHGEDVVTPLGRASFVYFTKPSNRFDEEDPKYQITLLFPKDDPKVQEDMRGMKEMCAAIFEQFCRARFEKDKPKVKYEDFRKAILEGFGANKMLRDGDLAKYEGYAGHWYIRAKAKPEEFKRVKFLPDGVGAEAFEPGVLVRLQVQPMVGQMGFAYKLRSALRVKDDGVRFATGPAPDSLLRELSDEVVDAQLAAAQVEESAAPAPAAKAAPAPSGLDLL